MIQFGNIKILYFILCNEEIKQRTSTKSRFKMYYGERPKLY